MRWPRPTSPSKANWVQPPVAFQRWNPLPATLTNATPGAGHCRSNLPPVNCVGTELHAVPLKRYNAPVWLLAANASLGPVMQTPSRREFEPVACRCQLVP